jgi:hypothetical protein
MITFDGPNRLIIPNGPPVNGIISITAIDMYSYWKQWVQQANNAKWAEAFRVVGGDPLTTQVTLSPYFFLLNGWRIRPYEANHTFEIDGPIVVDGGGEPVLPTLGAYNVLIRSILPMESQTAQHTDLTTPDGIELGVTMQEAMRIILAVAAGKTNITDLGGGLAEVIFRDTNDTKNRVIADMTGSERTTVTLDAT